MSEDQKRIIQEQATANVRMVRLNAERGTVYAHGQGPVNERVGQILSFLKSGGDQADSTAKRTAASKR